MAGSAAAYAALRPHLAWARKAAGTTTPLQAWSLPGEPPAQTMDVARALIGAAILAPSNWNSQPWRFEVEVGSIRLVADPQRALPATDPYQKAQMLSLGAALENLLVAARAYGLRPSVHYLPFGGANGVVAEVTWTNGDVRRDRGLFAAIPERRTNRRDYDGRAIFTQNRAQLMAQAPDGFRIHWLDDRARIEDMADLTRESVHESMTDKQEAAERFSWMRFGDDEAKKSGDGVSVDALEIGGPARWLAGKYFNPKSWFMRFGAQSAAKQARGGIRSAGALALLTAKQSGSAQWMTGGQMYERFALKATQLGIAHQPINEPIDRERFRARVLTEFDAVGEEPLMLVRLGHAKRPPATVRRGVAVVTSYRSS